MLSSIVDNTGDDSSGINKSLKQNLVKISSSNNDNPKTKLMRSSEDSNSFGVITRGLQKIKLSIGNQQMTAAQS